MLHPQTRSAWRRVKVRLRSRLKHERHPIKRALTATVAVAAAAMSAVSCGGSNQSSPSSSSTTTTTTTPSEPPLAPAALANLLLPLTDIDSALGATGTKAGKTFDALQPDPTAASFPKGYKFPAECVYATDAGIAPVYADTGNKAAHGEHDVAPA